MQKSWEFLWCFTIIFGYILQKYLWKDFVLFLTIKFFFCIKYATEATLWRKYWWLHRILFKSWYIIIMPLQAMLFVFCYSRCYRYIVTLPVTSIRVLQRCLESLRVLLYSMNVLICIYRKPITLVLTSQTAVFHITETDSHTVSHRAFLRSFFIDAKQWQKNVTNSSHWP